MGAMVGCEIVNEASNGTTRWGSGMDRLAHTRPAPRKDHIQCDLTNQQITHKPEENVTTIFLSLLWTPWSGWWWSLQGSNVFSEAVGLSKILLFIEIVAALKKGEERFSQLRLVEQWSGQLNSMPLNYTSLKQPVEHRCLFPSETFLSSFIAP